MLRFVFAAALTLLAATVAFARPVPVEEAVRKESSQPIYQNMTCREAIERTDKSFAAKFVIFLDSNFVSDGAAVMTDDIGTCTANAPATAYNALGRRFDIHSFTAGGASCRPRDGDVTFELFHDRSLGQSRHATLRIKNVIYNCEL